LRGYKQTKTKTKTKTKFPIFLTINVSMAQRTHKSQEEEFRRRYLPIVTSALTEFQSERLREREDARKQRAARRTKYSSDFGNLSSSQFDDNAPSSSFDYIVNYNAKSHRMHVNTNRKTFPYKLYDMLEDRANNKAIAWSDHGSSFKIIDSTLLEGVLRKYFRHGNVKSFIRVVYGWGFRKIGYGSSKGCYQSKVNLIV